MSAEKACLIIHLESDLTPALVDVVNNLLAEKTNVFAMVRDFSTASKWLSEREIYSFLLPEFLNTNEHGSKTLFADYKQFFAAISYFADYNFDQVLLGKQPHFSELATKAIAATCPRLEELDYGDYLCFKRLKKKQLSTMQRSMTAAQFSLARARAGSLQKCYLFLKVFVEAIVCFCLLILFLPVLIILSAFNVARVSPRAILGKSNRVRFVNIFDKKDSHDDADLPRWWWLPTLWNVCKGDVALIGPRLVLLAADPSANISNYSNLYFQLAPGLISRSQLKAGKGYSPEQLDELDQAYMHDCNPILDFKILLLAASSILRI